MAGTPEHGIPSSHNSSDDTRCRRSHQPPVMLLLLLRQRRRRRRRRHAKGLTAQLLAPWHPDSWPCRLGRQGPCPASHLLLPLQRQRGRSYRPVLR